MCVAVFFSAIPNLKKWKSSKKIDFYHLLLKHPTLIKFSKNHKEPIRLKMTTISGTIRIFCLIQKFKRFRFCLFVQNRPVSSKTKILGSKFYSEIQIFSKNFYGFANKIIYFSLNQVIFVG